MTYQGNLFDLETMQDRSGRLHDYPAPPKTRGECAPRRHLRALPPDDPNAERCQAFGCPHNLIGEIGRIRNQERAVEAIEARYECGAWETCALDVADDGGCSDRGAGLLLGITEQMVSQVVANAAFRFRAGYGLHMRHLDNMERAREHRSRRSRDDRILALHDTGHTLRGIAEDLACSTRTVQQVIRSRDE